MKMIGLRENRLCEETFKRLLANDINLGIFRKGDEGVVINIPKGALPSKLPGDLERVLYWAKLEGADWLLVGKGVEEEPFQADDLRVYQPGWNDRPPMHVDFESLAECIVNGGTLEIEEFLGYPLSAGVMEGLFERVQRVLLSLPDWELKKVMAKFNFGSPKFDDNTTVIAIDFDGTLTLDSSSYPEIGEPNWPVIKQAIRRQEEGACLVLWTCREGEHLTTAVKAARSWGLTFDFVNENPGFRKKMFGTDPRKVGADEYWEDRSIHLVKFGPEETEQAKVLIGEGGNVQRLVQPTSLGDLVAVPSKDPAYPGIWVAIGDGKYDNALVLVEVCDHNADSKVPEGEAAIVTRVFQRLDGDAYTHRIQHY